MAAMTEEIDVLLGLIKNPVIEREGMRDFVKGTLEGRACVAVFSRIGKVAAASTATLLIQRFGVDSILFAGVAGAIEPGLKVGDIVVGREFIQWDLDARPLFEYGEVPMLGMTRFPADERDTARLRKAIDRVLAARASDPENSDLTPHLTIVTEGLIATGDRFVGTQAENSRIRSLLPDAKCVEMETAAVAQVCYEHGVPFAAFRILSDSADDSAAMDFQEFLREKAGPIAAQAVVEFLRLPE